MAQASGRNSQPRGGSIYALPTVRGVVLHDVGGLRECDTRTSCRRHFRLQQAAAALGKTRIVYSQRLSRSELRRLVPPPQSPQLVRLLRTGAPIAL